jgi:hypothetical protein
VEHPSSRQSNLNSCSNTYMISGMAWADAFPFRSTLRNHIITHVRYHRQARVLARTVVNILFHIGTDGEVEIRSIYFFYI